MTRAIESRVRRLERSQAEDLITLGPYPPLQPEPLILSRRQLPQFLAMIGPTLGRPSLRPGYRRSLEEEPATVAEPWE